MPVVYLIPSLLADDGMAAISAGITAAVKDCQVFFAEDERTTRRYFKQLWKYYLPGEDIVIDNYEWVNMKDDAAAAGTFRQKIREGKNIGIISEAGCPGIADPGQKLVALAQEMNVVIKPLVGPSSILLALMASGMNGQQFQFNGYLPIESAQRIKAIKDLETESARKNCTQVFIETPYRNNQLLEALLKTCRPSTRICIAADITGKNEMIKTLTAAQWTSSLPNLHKRPVIFLLSATAT